MEFMKSVIALHLLSPHMKSFSCCPVSDNFKILANAISKFDVVVLDTKMEEVIEKMWSTTRSGLEDVDPKIISTTVIKYQLSSDSSGKLDGLNDSQYIKLRWLLGRCPLIVKGSASVYKSLQLCQHKTIVILDDDSKEETLENSTGFRHLSTLKTCENIYDKILENFSYTFQGKPGISLKFLLENYPELESDITINDLLLMMDNSFRIGGGKEDLPTPYIDRQLKTQLLDINNLNHFDEDTLIVISCVEQNRHFIDSLQNINLISVEEFVKTDIKSSGENYSKYAFPEHHQSDGLKVAKKDIFVSDKQCSIEQFNIICVKNSKFVKCHNFKIRSDGLLEWVQSKGCTTDLEKYMKEHDIREAELYFMSSLNYINLIIADPGMGKSVILRSIKNNVPPQFCTIILDPNDINLSCQQFKKINDKSEKMIELIFSQKFKGAEGFETKLTKLMREKHRVLVMWDALDEISSEQLDITMNMILQLSRSGIKQLVTTRPHLKKTLETKFEVISRSICRFDTLQQKSYIRERLVTINCSEQHFNSITNNIIDNLHFSQHIDIIGVPLQIFMLTELIIGDSEKYLKQLAKIVSLSDLFAYFIEEKLNVHCNENLQMSSWRQQKKVSELKKNAVKNLKAAALLLLMEKQFLQKLGVNSEDVLNKINDEGEWYGLLIGMRDDGLPVFMHNSYAEYLVADYFARNYKHIPKIENILFQEKYTNIRLFFDLLLATDSPVHIAAIYGNLENLKNYGYAVTKHKDKGGRNPLHLACSWATRHSLLNIRLFKQYMLSWPLGPFNRYEVNTENDTTSQGENANNKNILEYLLNKYDPLEKDTIFEIDSLSYAQMSGCLYANGTIIKNKKCDNMKLKRREDPRYVSNIYYYSAKFGYENLMNMFEMPIIVTARGETLLHICAEYNQKPCLQRLLFTEKYRRIINDRDVHGESSLHIACRHGHLEIVQLLLQASANPNITSKSKWTPLHSACKFGNLEIVQLLVQSGAEINAANDSKLTPFHIAFLRKHEEIVQFFEEVGICKEEILKTGVTSLHAASRMGNEKFVKSLIECGADIDGTNDDGETPLHSGSRYGHAGVVKLLIDASAKIETANNDGWTPLHSASRYGHAGVVKLLTDASAKIETANKEGWTSLCLASRNGHAEVVKLLIDASAKIEAADNDG